MTDDFTQHEQTENPTYSQVMLDTKGIPAPSPGSSAWRHPLFVLILGSLIVMCFAVVGMFSALLVVNGTKNDVQDQLSCSRKYSTATSNAQAQVLGNLGEAQSAILTAIAAGAAQDQATVDEQIALVPKIAKSLDTATKNLNSAIKAQEASLKICT